VRLSVLQLFGVVSTDNNRCVPFQREDVLGQEAVAALAVGLCAVAATLLELVLGGLERPHKVQPVRDRLEAGLVPAIRRRGPRNLDLGASVVVVAHDDAVGLGGDVDDAFDGCASAACVGAADVRPAFSSAALPMPMALPVVPARSAANPKTVFSLPVVLNRSAQFPTAVLFVPVVVQSAA
jgi:hypothetical protein